MDRFQPAALFQFRRNRANRDGFAGVRIEQCSAIELCDVQRRIALPLVVGQTSSVAVGPASTPGSHSSPFSLDKNRDPAH